MVLVGEGVSRLLVEARWAAEPDPLRVGEDWAEAVVMPTAKAAKMRKLFIETGVELWEGIAVLRRFIGYRWC